MASSHKAGDGGRSSRNNKVYRPETQQWLIFAKATLPSDVYNEFVNAMKEIWKQSADPDGEIRNISVDNCVETAMKLFHGQAHVIKGFLNLTQGRSPFHEGLEKLKDPVAFLRRVKACPDISTKDYEALLGTLLDFSRTRTMTVEDVFQKVKGFIGNCPKLLEGFKYYLPPHLGGSIPDDRSCMSPKTNRIGKAVLSFTPDANHGLDGIRVKAANKTSEVSQLEHSQDYHDRREYSFRQKYTRRVPDLIQKPRKEGNEESPYAEEDEGDKVEPLPDWIPSRINELPPKVGLGICKPCTPSYCLLPKNCITLQSSYRTELGRSIFNDGLVSGTSGSEHKTKSEYEEDKVLKKIHEEIFKLEDDMFESDMLLQRFRSTADFITNLQDRVGSDMKIQEYLTPLHRRCIEKLYDDHGLDMLDALLESQNASASLAVLLSRLNQKLEDLSETRLSLHKTCSDIFDKKYHRSLDHRSPSFKQLDIKRMTQKALQAEAKEINKTKFNAGDKHVSSACNKQYTLVSENILSYTDLDVQEDIGSIIYYASSSCASEDKQVLPWTELVQLFLSVNSLWPDLKETVALDEACENCGISKDFFSSIPNALPANKFFPSSKISEFPRNKSNDCSSSHDDFDAEMEEGEFIPDAENIQLDAMHGPNKKRTSYDAAAFNGDELSFPHLATDTSGCSTCHRGNESEEPHESRDDSNNDLASLAYSKRTAKMRNVNGRTPCCSLAVLCRIHQILYERLLVAKQLSRDARNKVLLRDACARDLYAEFKAKLCGLLDRSTDKCNFEEFCLKFLGPKSYVLFTLDLLIRQLMRQLCRISLSGQDKLFLQFLEKFKRPNLSKDLSQHQNARCSPTRLSDVLLKHDREEQGKGNEPLNDTGKPMPHFERRKRRKLENVATSLSQPGVEDSNS